MSRLKHKRGRKSNYLKSLNTDYHREVRRKVLIRDNFKCKICESTLFLELHHISYYVNSENIVGKELQYLEWLVILCAECHQLVHDNIRHQYNPKNKNKTYV